MENQKNVEWKVISEEEDDENVMYGYFSVIDQSGEIVATVHGRTIGDVIDNAELIASAPRLRRERDEAREKFTRLQIHAHSLISNLESHPCTCDWREKTISQLLK